MPLVVTPRAGATRAAHRPRFLPLSLLVAATLLLGGCQRGPSAEAQRIDELEFKIQQLEERVNKVASERANGSDRSGKPPAGVVKSLTLRSGTDDDRLRIYWADGSTTDLPCTKEQATLVCG
ncbi:MAG: hypothetical protein ACK522_06555 [Synechococcaceae cyanobacterium]|jgi:outer membrane murein-binding lipoprotein Lpp